MTETPPPGARLFDSDDGDDDDDGDDGDDDDDEIVPPVREGLRCLLILLTKRSD